MFALSHLLRCSDIDRTAEWPRDPFKDTGFTLEGDARVFFQLAMPEKQTWVSYEPTLAVLAWQDLPKSERYYCSHVHGCANGLVYMTRQQDTTFLVSNGHIHLNDLGLLGKLK